MGIPIKTKKVTGSEFYKKIGSLDVTTFIQEPYPYTSLFKLRKNQKLVGKIVEKYSEYNKYPIVIEYLLVEKED